MILKLKVFLVILFSLNVFAVNKQEIGKIQRQKSAEWIVIKDQKKFLQLKATSFSSSYTESEYVAVDIAHQSAAVFAKNRKLYLVDLSDLKRIYGEDFAFKMSQFKNIASSNRRFFLDPEDWSLIFMMDLGNRSMQAVRTPHSYFYQTATFVSASSMICVSFLRQMWK